jgi:hypothetical protein
MRACALPVRRFYDMHILNIRLLVACFVLWVVNMFFFLAPQVLFDFIEGSG